MTKKRLACLDVVQDMEGRPLENTDVMTFNQHWTIARTLLAKVLAYLC